MHLGYFQESDDGRKALFFKACVVKVFNLLKSIICKSHFSKFMVLYYAACKNGRFIKKLLELFCSLQNFRQIMF